MKHKLFSSILFATSILLVGCTSTSNADLSAVAKRSIFSESVSGIKTRSEYKDENGQKGLLLYGYENGASIDFGCSYNGIFKASMSPVKNDFGSIDLKEFSLLFTEKTTKEQFSIKVFIYSNYYYAAVCYNGQLAGVNYYNTTWSSGGQHGFTAIANQEGRYTELDSKSSIELSFDPKAMVVQAKTSDGATRNVWDFKNEYNDGKQLTTKLSNFDEYDISIIFDNVNNNGCADLLMYSFAGYDLSSSSLNNVSPIINTNIKTNAIVGQKYDLPNPSVASPTEGGLNANDVSIQLFDRFGSQISLNNGGFTPSEEGYYYAYYSYSHNNLSASTYARIKAVNESDASIEFSEPYFATVVGAGTKLTIPEVKISTNLGTNTSSFDCNVTVKKDGVPVEGYINAKTNSDITLSDKGTYTFTYSNPSFKDELTKTVIVDGRLAVNESDSKSVYSVGDYFDVPEISFMKSGRSVSYRAKVYSPTGEELKTPFLIEDEGYYSVSYDLDSEIEPYVKECLVQKNTTTIFDGVDATYEVGTTNNKVKGVNLNLKTNEVATFNQVINLNKFGFNNSLEDLSQNQEFIKFYVQPKTQGLPDLDTIYITLTDVNDPSNYITIRSKYFSYRTSGSLLRTRANGQNYFVGYSYDFSSTKMHADNAPSHEDGGFASYLNYSSVCCGEEYENHGLPLYFDNDAGRLYSRPAWLTGHNIVSTDHYNEIKVPWLVYDYKSDDANYNGGNSPWKGFESGLVNLSISGKGISGSANIIVTSINGQELSNDHIEDTDAPKIDIVKDDFIYNEVDSSYTAPTAKVGNPYKLFKCNTSDTTSRVKDTVVSVYDPDGAKLAIEGDSFVPTKAGNYRVVYEASDVFKNKTTEEVTVNAQSGISPISLDLNTTLPSSIYFGEELSLPSASYSGGSGNLKLDVKVTSNTGKDVPVNNMKVKVLEPGTSYTVEYKVTDYLGETKTLTKNINVEISKNVIFDQNSLVLPTAFIHNDTYRFNALVGTYYDSNYKGTPVSAKISVVDAKGSTNVGDDLLYTPTYSEAVNTAAVKISFDANNTNVSYNYNIPVVKAKTNSSNYITSFFTSEGATVTGSSKGITFASNGDSTMSFEFLRGIDSNDLLVDLPLNKDKMSFSSIDITLRDIYNANERVKLTYTYHYDPKTEANKLFVSLNDSKTEYVVNTGIDNTLRVSYNSANHKLIDATGATITTIGTYEDGSAFNGFNSGSVYFSANANGIQAGNFEIMVSRINNQGTNTTRNDYQEPDIIVNGRILSRVSSGSTVTIPTAICYDVLNNVGELTVNVKTDDGKVILADTTPNIEQTLTLNDCGTYIVTYSVTDANGNTAERVFVITVYDDVSPELKFASSIPEEVKVGTTLTLPKYTIIDNDDTSTVSVVNYVFTPNGILKDVKNNKVTFDTKGTYYITYIATDKNGNSTLYRFKVVAK